MHDNWWLCIMNLGKIISVRAFPNSFKEVRFLLTSKMASMTPRLLADEFEVRESVIITLRNSNTYFLAGWEIRRVRDEKTGSVSAPGSPSFSLSDPSWMKETQQFLRLRNYIIIMLLSSVLKFSVIEQWLIYFKKKPKPVLSLWPVIKEILSLANVYSQ